MESKEILTELRGRFLEINVFPLSFREFLNFKNLRFNFKEARYVGEKRAEILKALLKASKEQATWFGIKRKIKYVQLWKWLL